MKHLALLFALLTATAVLAAEPAMVFSFSNEKLEFGVGDISDAAPVIDAQSAGPIVFFRMSAAKAKAFGQMTSRHVGEVMGLTVCGKLISSPNIQTPIYGDSLQISGGLDAKSASEIARKLKTGTCN
jgi:preprotein translocase subunit SecD